MQPEMQTYDAGRDLLKWIAVATMTVDHVGLILYPQVPLLRYVGRISFPLFAYLLVLGMSTTRDPQRYLGRLILFAFVSQVPYAAVFGFPVTEQLNIFFTLSLGFVFVYLLDVNNVLFVVPLAASLLLPFEYGAYGIATILILYILRSQKAAGVALFVSLNLLIIPFDAEYQPLAIFALPLILLHSSGVLGSLRLPSTGHPTLSKYFFYAYYPLHIIVLGLISGAI